MVLYSRRMVEPARCNAVDGCAADSVVFDPPEPKRPRRLRPHVQGSVGADVAAALEAEHAKRGGPFGHALEAVLRRGLGLDPAA